MSDRISRDELQALEAGSRPPAIIDVRDRDEYVAGHLPGAIHIPAGELPRRLAEIPRGRPVVTY